MDEDGAKEEATHVDPNFSPREGEGFFDDDEDGLALEVEKESHVTTERNAMVEVEMTPFKDGKQEQ